MDPSILADDERFRSAVRDWFAVNFSGRFAALRGRGGGGDEEMWGVTVAWERHLADAGWLGLAWPRKLGGKGASGVQQVIFQEEYARVGAPTRITHLGEMMLGPTLIQHASVELQRRFLPGILSVEELWCQGYSEPDAGSDLANIRTRAERDGDEWVINGQKTWTSLAHHADYCFALCRTDKTSDRHDGISYLLVPMKQAGVTTRPIRQMSGAAEFNEVFFEDARAPADWVVGEVGGGWSVAMATLGFERSRRLALFPTYEAELWSLVEVARARGVLSDERIRDRIARSYTDLMVMRSANLRTLSSLASGEAPGPVASIGKLFWSQWHQGLAQLALDIEGLGGIAGFGVDEAGSASSRFLHSRAATIYAGSSEIQRNILSERILGLPRG